MDEAFVTDAIARHLARRGWTLHSVARPQIGSGVALRPNPHEDGRRERVKGAVVIDIIASRRHHWLFLECKDRFSARDLGKLLEVRDTGTYERDLAKLTGSRSRENRLFGLGMPSTRPALREVAGRDAALDVFLGVDEAGKCLRIGGARHDLAI